MEYFLNGTKEALGFDQVLDLISPKSIYGKGEKSKLKPFLPGEEEDLTEEFVKIRECAGKLRGMEQHDWQRLQGDFAIVPNIKEEIDLVRQGLLLNEINLFNIKKFLYLSLALFQLLEYNQLVPQENYLALLPPKEMEQEYLNQNQGYQFYLGDYGGEDYRQLQTDIKGLLVLGTEAAKNDLNDLEDALGLENNSFSDNYLYVSKNDQGLWEKALETPRLERYQDFGSEVCFLRKITPAEKILEEEIKKKRQEIEVLELDVRRRLTNLIKQHIAYFDQGQKEMGYCDLLLAKAVFMVRYNCTIPKITMEKTIDLQQGININIKNELEKNDKKFTPITLNFAQKSVVITGANMGGKTVTLRTLGLSAAMAQHGIPVPAKKFHCPLFHFLFWAGEYKEKTGLSSFATEIERLQMILGRIEERGLVLLDEPARSTNPQEGLAIVGAFLKKVAQGNPITIVITHFEGLARLVGAEHWQVRGVKNVKKLLQEEDLEKYFDYSLEKVEIDTQVPRDAIKVAELLGLEKGVLAEAKMLFQEIGKGGPK